MSSSFTGLATSSCCGVGGRKIAIIYRWGEGSVVYSVKKARHGILEAVAIKKVIFVSGRQTLGRITFLYQDTYNSYWNENDLCTEDDARTLAINYLEQQQAKLQQAMSECSIPAQP